MVLLLLLLGVSNDADEFVDIDEDDADVETSDLVELSDAMDDDDTRPVTSAMVAAGADGGEGESTGDGAVVSVDIAGADWEAAG